jgi:hypothetical protein
MEMNRAMKIEKMSNLALLLILALFTNQLLITNASFFSYRYVIHIQNELFDTVYVHCKSEDQDLGRQQIKAGEELPWVIYKSFWSINSYNFVCDLSWLNAHAIIYSNRLFTFVDFCDPVKLFGNKDLNCVWRVKREGVYIFYYKKQEFLLDAKWE